MQDHPPDMPHGLNLPALHYLASTKRVQLTFSVPGLKQIDAAAKAQGVSRSTWLEIAAGEKLTRLRAQREKREAEAARSISDGSHENTD
jgi:hypothetical protein